MRHAVLVLLAVSLGSTAGGQSSGPYQITHTYALGGDGGWDYIVPDPPQHRLFIGRQNRVMVVDENDGKLLGEVTGIDGAHGTALADRRGHGFATSGNDGSILMFDLKTLETLGKTPAAEDADAIIYDAPSDRVFSFNGDAHSSTVVDASTGKLVTLTTPQGSRNLGLDPVTHRVFIVSATFGPAPAGGRGRGPVLPGSFKLMVIEHQ